MGKVEAPTGKAGLKSRRMTMPERMLGKERDKASIRLGDKPWRFKPDESNE